MYVGQGVFGIADVVSHREQIERDIGGGLSLEENCGLLIYDVERVPEKFSSWKILA